MEFKKFKLLESIRDQKTIRVVAFGSSNTQRRIPGMHWFDYLELAFKSTYGKNCGQFINSGVGGNTSQDLLQRFDSELKIFLPHLVILTIGGNDAHPSQNISPKKFRHNICDLSKRILQLDAELLLQTYYGCDLDRLESGYVANLLHYMQIIRQIAKDEHIPLIDHFPRWDHLRQTDIKLYRSLMLDPMHVNPLGNMVLGLDLLRRFELELNADFYSYCHEGLFVQMVLDQLENHSCQYAY